MHLSRVQILNFRNFAAFNVALDANVVIVGENRVGKSNFILALRLVLDASLPDSARQLKLSDIWDDLDGAAEPRVEIHLDFADFDTDPALVALLTDYRLAEDYRIARLSYVFRKKAEVGGAPKSEADFEFRVFGGGDEARGISGDVRRRLCLDVLHALRDAEGDLAAWRSSPLRPLLEDAISKVSEADIEAVAGDIDTATKRMSGLAPIAALETDLRTKIAALAGYTQDIRPKLGFAPTDPLRLFRSIRVFIDDGKRGIADASVGSANLAFLTLKLAEFAWRRLRNERNFTLVCIEEPEAHLHPHLQRTVFQRLFGETKAEHRSLILTTHSPNIASVAPLPSIVVLKSHKGSGTQGYSLARLTLAAADLEDLQRYLDASHAEILFARGVVFVEGDAEAALVPVFAQTIGYDLDALGITVCNVGGTNFAPYVKLAVALSLPFSVITDWDPLDGTRRPLGWDRSLGLLDDIRATKGEAPSDKAVRATLETNEHELLIAAGKTGIFLNGDTLETEIARTATLAQPLLDVLGAGGFGPIRQARIALWKAEPGRIDGEQLLAMIADIGKGRLAARLAAKAAGLQPPAYIASALKHVTAHG